MKCKFMAIEESDMGHICFCVKERTEEEKAKLILKKHEMGQEFDIHSIMCHESIRSKCPLFEKEAENEVVHTSA